jgi:hypothetical protein
MTRSPLRIGLLAKSLLAPEAPPRCIQLGWDGGDAICSLSASVPNAEIEVIGDGAEPEEELPPGTKFRDEKLLDVKLEREYDLIIVRAGSPQFVLGMYMAIEAALVEGGFVMVTGYETADCKWLWSEMVKEGVMSHYKTGELREIAVFSIEAGRLSQEL